MIRVGITGMSGFVGQHVYSHLSKDTYSLFGFSRKGDYIYWDITERLPQELPELDIVIHCAGTVDDWASYQKCYQNNVKGTQNVLNAFPRIKKFIYISSCSVYDMTENDYKIDEKSQCQSFLNGYSKSKYEAERTLLEQEGIVQKIILRPHVIYGEDEEKLIPRLLQAHRVGRFIVLGNGENHISITHIENLCSAIERVILHKENIDKQIFNITDAQPITINSLLKEFKQEFGIKAKNFHIQKDIAYAVGFVLENIWKLICSKKPPFLTRYIVRQMTTDHEISIKKAQGVLGYTPEKTIFDFFKKSK